MPLDLVNLTPYTAVQLPLTAPNGATVLQTVVKAGYQIVGGRLALEPEPPPVVFADTFWGAEGASAVRNESEVGLTKPCTDLVVVGHAVAPDERPASSVEVGLSVDRRELKRIRVSGDRRWERVFGRWMPSDPQRFVRLPLSYDRAYGGSTPEGSEPRNRVGLGFVPSGTAVPPGHPLPNVELADALVGHPREMPPPAGLGVVARDWSPRLGWAGTYDQRWQDEVFPLLPADFDPRFNQCVDEAQWLRTVLGGERIEIRGVHPSHPLVFSLPDPHLEIRFRHRTRGEEHGMMHLETIWVETDEQRVVLTWKAEVDIHGDPFALEETRIGASNGAPYERAACC